jgi:TPR repeat protein
MYANGEGVGRDLKEAAKWYRLAADQGQVVALNALGIMYATGEGVGADAAEAEKLFRQAAAQGDEQAKGNLEILARQAKAAAETK